MTVSNEERIRFANDELFAKGNLDAVEDVFATDYVAHAGGKEYHGHDCVKMFVRMIRSAIPNLRVAKVEFLMQSSGQVVWQRTLSGTHEAEMMGIPATGQKVEWTDMLVTLFSDEKIAEEWAVSELAGQLLSKPRRA